MQKNLHKITPYCHGKTILRFSKYLQKKMYDLKTKDLIIFADGHIMRIYITKDEKKIIITKNGINHCSLKSWDSRYKMMLTLPQKTIIKKNINGINKRMVWRQNGKIHRNEVVPAVDQDIIGEFNEPDINRKIHLPSIVSIYENKDTTYKLKRYSFYLNGFLYRKDKLINKEYGILTKLPTNILYQEHFNFEPKYIVNKYFWFKNNKQHRSEKHPIYNFIFPAYICTIPNTFIDQSEFSGEEYFLCGKHIMSSKNGRPNMYIENLKLVNDKKWSEKYNGNYYIYDNKLYMKKIGIITNNIKKIRIE
jgi:hypothetical protein